MSSTYENFKLYFPFIFKEAVDMQEGCGEIVVKLRDGTTMLYDDYDRTIRNLPESPDSMNEIQCKLEFGKRLNRKMFSRGLTQAMLSEKTGIPQAQLSSYITGRVSPSFYKADKIAKALGCSMDELRYT